MNKNQFLAELSQYLTFATAEERQSLMRYYDSMFSGTLPEDEAKLILELDTPMKTAINLRRRKDSGEDLRLIGESAQVAEAPAVDEAPVVETPVAETPVVETPAAETPVVETPVVEAPVVDTPAVETPVVETPVVETPVVETPVVETPVAETPVAEAPVVETPEYENSEIDISYKELDYDELISEENPEYRDTLRRPAVTVGYVFKLIGVILLGIIIAAACLPIAAVGVFLLASMGNLIIAGLSSLYYTTDALLLFGGGLMLGAPGIIVVWLALWIAVKLISKLTDSLKR